MPFESCSDYFSTISDRFNPEASGGVTEVFQWELSGAEEGTHHVSIADGGFNYSATSHESPTTVLVADSADYLKIVNKQMNGLRAVLTGKMKVRGNRIFARKMEKIFPLD
jgi:putative sterol carrier protein